MKKSTIILGAFFLLLAFIISDIPSLAEKPIKILMPTSLTGNFAGVEEFFRNGGQLAVDDINAAGGVKGREVKLIMEDTQSTISGAVNALQKLVDANPDAAMIHGGLMSHFALAWDPIIRKAGLPFFTGASSVRITAQGNPWIFRTRPSDKIWTGLLVKYIVDNLKPKKIGIFYDTSEYGKGGKVNFVEYLKERGITPAIIEAHNTGDKDFTPQFLKFQSKGIDLLLAWNHPVEAALTVRFWHQLGRPFQLVGNSGYPPFQLVWGMVKGAAEGVIAVSDVNSAIWTPEKNPELAAKYKSKFKKNMISFHLLGYDPMRLMGAALKAFGPDPKKLRDGLHGEFSYKGYFCSYKFDEYGDGVWEVDITQIKNGKPVILQTVRMK